MKCLAWIGILILAAIVVSGLALWATPTAAIVTLAVILFLITGRIELTLVAVAPSLAILALVHSAGGWFGYSMDSIPPAAVSLLFCLGSAYALLRLKAVLARYRGRVFSDSVLSAGALLAMVVCISLVLAGPQAWRAASSFVLAGCAGVLLATHFLVPALMRFFLPREGFVPPRSLQTVLGGALILFYITSAASAYILFIHPLYLLLKLIRPRKAFQTYLHLAASLLMHAFPYGQRIFLECKPEKFPRPCIVVANHESQSDITLVLSMPVDQRMVIKDWVWKNPIVGPMVRGVGFLLTTGDNAAALLEDAKRLLASGISVMMFPEGSRSRLSGVQRFHKGAFQLAVETGTPVVPIALVDTRSCVRDNSWVVGHHVSVIHPLPPLDPQVFRQAEDPALAMARETRRQIQAAHRELHPLTCPDWVVRQKIKERFNYLGPKVENYVYWKLRLDPVYPEVAKKLPPAGSVLDLGCGYGLMGHWAAITGWGREITGVDADENKIRAAQATVRYQPGLKFVRANVLEFSASSAETLLLLDVLHYWSLEQQAALVRKARSMTSANSILIFRDACLAGPEAVLASERWSTAVGLNQKYEGLFFRDREGWIRLFENAGFRLREDAACGLGDKNRLFVFEAVQAPPHCGRA